MYCIQIISKQEWVLWSLCIALQTVPGAVYVCTVLELIVPLQWNGYTNLDEQTRRAELLRPT